ncbi:hypothetical protein LTR93_011605 [Exophiala xenobiotica]|nr:hypothetical protein LTR93_011605 [Exophiala xenobiotica]
MGIVGISQLTAYCAAKHAIIGLTRTASEDHAPKGLRVNCVCPGYIDTPIQDATPEMRRLAHEKRYGQPQEVADAVLYLSGGRSSFVTGFPLVVDGGYTSH